nr:hypothetical protein [Tanacetum cinerariifolium]
AQPSPKYVSGLEYPPLPNYVPAHVYPEFMPLEDKIFPAEEQPLPAAVSPIVDLPGYVPESGFNKDPKEDPADYHVDGGDDDDDDDESSDDDEKDDDVEEEENEVEEEHWLLPTLQLLLYQLLIMLHLLKRLSHLRPTSLHPYHHHILHTALLLGCPSDLK